MPPVSMEECVPPVNYTQPVYPPMQVVDTFMNLSIVILKTEPFLHCKVLHCYMFVLFSDIYSRSGIEKLYCLSYLYYCLSGALITAVIVTYIYIPEVG